MKKTRTHTHRYIYIYIYTYIHVQNSIEYWTELQYLKKKKNNTSGLKRQYPTLTITRVKQVTKAYAQAFSRSIDAAFLFGKAAAWKWTTAPKDPEITSNHRMWWDRLRHIETLMTIGSNYSAIFRPGIHPLFGETRTSFWGSSPWVWPHVRLDHPPFSKLQCVMPTDDVYVYLYYHVVAATSSSPGWSKEIYGQNPIVGGPLYRQL